MSTIPWCCPNCGNTLKLRERVTQLKRKCSQCGEPITTEEIDRQIGQAQAEIAAQQAAANKVWGVAFGAFVLLVGIFYCMTSASNRTATEGESSKFESKSNSVNLASTQIPSLTAEPPPSEYQVQTEEVVDEVLEDGPPIEPPPEPSPVAVVPPVNSNSQSDNFVLSSPLQRADAKMAAWCTVVEPVTERQIDNIILFSDSDDQASLLEKLRELQEQNSSDDRSESSRTIELERQGKRAIAMGNYEEAALAFGQVCNSGQETAENLSKLAYAQMMLDDLDSAKSNLYRSVSLVPTREIVWDDLALVFAKKHEQTKSVSCFAIAYRLSNGKTLSYLQSLSSDKNIGIRLAADEAVKKLTAYP